jgi:TRAP-type uncharacterized transport system fused permease subunit
MSTAIPDTDQETADKLQSLELAQRPAESTVGRFVYWIGVLFSLTHIYFNTLGTWSELYVSAVHFGGFALICALMVPGFKSQTRAGQRTVLVLDILVGLAAIACAFYLIRFEDALYDRGVEFVTLDWVFSLLAIGVALEMARRTTGWFIPSLIVVALTYVFWWGPFIGGMFGFAGLSLETLLYRSYFGSDGMFGSIARISWTFVFMFILFGAFLVRSGAGDFIIELSRCAAGRFVGGPGFVAVLGSGLMGSVSGSSDRLSGFFNRSRRVSCSSAALLAQSNSMLRRCSIESTCGPAVLARIDSGTCESIGNSSACAASTMAAKTSGATSS